MNEAYYHVYSFGEDTPKLLTTEREFVIAVNILAYCATILNVRVMVFIFMNSHFHLVLYGTESECKRFGEELMKRLLRKINTIRKHPYSASEVSVSAEPVADREQLMRIITYDVRNSIEAGFPLDPRFYQWCSGSLYFAPRETGGRLISSMSIRERKEIMGVYYSYPEDWTISENGAVNYRHFVDFKGVESIYGGVRVYIAFMFIKKDLLLQMNMKCSKYNYMSVSDGDLLAEAKGLSLQLFKSDLEKLDVMNRIKLAHKLRKSYKTGLPQLARVLDLNLAMLESILS